MELKDHSFLAIFEPLSRLRLLEEVLVVDMKDGEFIFRQGDISDALYLVLAGSVLLTTNTSGRQDILAVAEADDFFGEFGVLDGEPRSTSAVVNGAVRLARIPGRLLVQELGAPENSAAIKLMIRTVRKMRQSNIRHVGQLLEGQKMALLGEVVLGVVHDFRSPLSVVLMATELLESGGDDPAVVRECRELIAEQVQHATAMAEEVLDYARGKTTLRLEPVDLAALLRCFVGLNERFMRAKGIRLVHKCADQCTVMADAGRLRRVLQNLVFNAADAMGSDGGSIAVFLEAPGADSVRILVRDNGPGIPKEIRDRVFEPFQTKGSKKGLGLGLAIARQFVEAHGGRLTFASDCNRGTVFSITLPLSCS
jgi:signal transduction histidine kinase